MDYIEKAKYELILALKNNESQNVINVLQQYYNDMVNIVKDNCNFTKKNNKQQVKYVLSCHFYDDDEDSKYYFFTSETKLIEFYKSNNKPDYSTIIEVSNIDPTNIIEFSSEIEMKNKET